LLCAAPFTPCAADGDGGGHGTNLTTKGRSTRRDLVAEERGKMKECRKWKVDGMVGG